MTVSDGPDSSPTFAPRPERQAAFHLGISAESRAAAFLIAKGFRILARRGAARLAKSTSSRAGAIFWSLWKLKRAPPLRMPPSRSISGNAAESPPPLKSGSRQIRTRVSAIVVLMQFWWHPAKFRGTSRRLLKQADQALNRSKN